MHVTSMERVKSFGRIWGIPAGIAGLILLKEVRFAVKSNTTLSPNETTVVLNTNEKNEQNPISNSYKMDETPAKSVRKIKAVESNRPEANTVNNSRISKPSVDIDVEESDFHDPELRSRD